MLELIAADANDRLLRASDAAGIDGGGMHAVANAVDAVMDMAQVAQACAATPVEMDELDDAAIASYARTLMQITSGYALASKMRHFPPSHRSLVASIAPQAIASIGTGAWIATVNEGELQAVNKKQTIVGAE